MNHDGRVCSAACLILYAANAIPWACVSEEFWIWRENTYSSAADRHRLHRVGVCPDIGTDRGACVPFRCKRRRGGGRSKGTQGEESAPCSRISPTWPWGGRSCPLSALLYPSLVTDSDGLLMISLSHRPSLTVRSWGGSQTNSGQYPVRLYFDLFASMGYYAIGSPGLRSLTIRCHCALVFDFGDYGCMACWCWRLSDLSCGR